MENAETLMVRRRKFPVTDFHRAITLICRVQTRGLITAPWPGLGSTAVSAAEASLPSLPAADNEPTTVDVHGDMARVRSGREARLSLGGRLLKNCRNRTYLAAAAVIIAAPVVYLLVHEAMRTDIPARAPEHGYRLVLPAVALGPAPAALEPDVDLAHLPRPRRLAAPLPGFGRLEVEMLPPGFRGNSPVRRAFDVTRQGATLTIGSGQLRQTDPFQVQLKYEFADGTIRYQLVSEPWAIVQTGQGVGLGRTPIAIDGSANPLSLELTNPEDDLSLFITVRYLRATPHARGP